MEMGPTYPNSIRVSATVGLNQAFYILPSVALLYTSENPMTALNQKKSKRLVLSLVPVYICTCGVFYSWAIFFLLPFWSVVYLTPILLAILIALTALSYGPFKNLRIKVPSLAVLLLFGLLTVVLIVSAPFYATWYGRSIANHFVEELDVSVTLDKQEVQLLDHYNDIAPPRHVRTTYTLLEPSSVVAEKLESRLLVINVWDMWPAPPDYQVSLGCKDVLHSDGTYRFASFNTGLALKDDSLGIILYYRSSPECLLQK